MPSPEHDLQEAITVVLLPTYWEVWILLVMSDSISSSNSSSLYNVRG